MESDKGVVPFSSWTWLGLEICFGNLLGRALSPGDSADLRDIFRSQRLIWLSDGWLNKRIRNEYADNFNSREVHECNLLFGVI